jgi:Uma2 family endonuclease
LGDEHQDTLTDPTIVVDIDSPVIERYDRTFQFAHYQKLASLTDYLLVVQDRIEVERRTRKYVIVDLSSIGCTFRMRDVYERVEFAPLTPRL